MPIPLYITLYRHTSYYELTAVVLYYIVYGSHVRNSLYNNVRYIRVVMCVNAMWMCHHWFMHIETHPCLGRSHTRASTIVITVIIRNTFHVHMALPLFLTPPPKMGRSPRDNNFSILAIIVLAWYPHAASMIPVMKGTTFLPICQKFEIFAANLRWMNWTPPPKMHFGGANDRINYPN